MYCCQKYFAKNLVIMFLSYYFMSTLLDYKILKIQKNLNSTSLSKKYVKKT